MAWSAMDKIKSGLQRVFGTAREGGLLETSRQSEDRAAARENANGQACLDKSFKDTIFYPEARKNPSRYDAIATSSSGQVARVQLGGTTKEPSVDVTITGATSGSIVDGVDAGTTVRIQGNVQDLAKTGEQIRAYASQSAGSFGSNEEFTNQAATAVQIGQKALDCAKPAIQKSPAAAP